MQSASLIGEEPSKKKEESTALIEKVHQFNNAGDDLKRSNIQVMEMEIEIEKVAKK